MHNFMPTGRKIQGFKVKMSALPHLHLILKIYNHV